MTDIGTLVRRATDAKLSTTARHTAFQQVVRLSEFWAHREACRYLRDTHLAQDAVQEAFLYASRRLDQLRNPDKFAGWFRRVIWTQCHLIVRQQDWARYAPLEAAHAVPSPDADALALLEHESERENVRRAVESLPDHEAAVLRAFYFGGQSTDEISRVWALSLRRFEHGSTQLDSGYILGSQRPSVPGEQAGSIKKAVGLPGLSRSRSPSPQATQSSRSSRRVPLWKSAATPPRCPTTFRHRTTGW